MYIYVLLQPRKFKFKTKQKGRSASIWTYEHRLNYGDCGLQIFRPTRFSSRQIFRLKVLLKRAVRKPDLTKRYIWFNTFPHLPLTKKSKGMRMGKGAGKLNAWQFMVRGGSLLLEFKNIRRGRALYFFKRIAVKIPTPVRPVYQSSLRLKFAGHRSTNPLLRVKW